MIVAALLLFGSVKSLNEINLAAASANIYKKPIGQRIEFFARQLVDTPYVGATLDQDPKTERCTVLLSGLDCVTFMETALALARTPNPTAVNLTKAVTFTRYRGGKVNGYLSRLHYTTDWFFDNQRKGTINDISKTLSGATEFTRKVNFMTTHPDNYAALKANPSLINELSKTEDQINSRTSFYVPRATIGQAELQLKTGDIIGLVGGAKGIDISHVGLIVVEDKIPHLVHASITRKLVTFGPRLTEYLEGSRLTEGIIVARPVENLGKL